MSLELPSQAGSALSLGVGDTGQLGLGPDVMERTKPGKVSIADKVVQVCSGGMHSVCLTDKGEVYTFGCNDEGALGRSTPDEDECMDPGKVELRHRAVQVSAGDSHSGALTDEGRVFIWGTFRDANGRIGLLPDGSQSATPVEIMQGHKMAKIASGGDHLVCLTDKGDIYTLGTAEQGQLGRVAECFSIRGGRKGFSLLLTPGLVHCRRRHEKFCDIWTGQYVTYAKAKDTGKVYAWGLNNYFQLGFSDMKNRFVPEQSLAFDAAKDWQVIDGGQHHTLALDKDGKVYALGRKEYGRLGLGEDVDEEKNEPTLVTKIAGDKCVTVNCGSSVSYAVTETGTVYGWGMGTSQQLGQSEDDDLWEPTRLQGKQLEDKKVAMVSAGGQHTLLLVQDKS